ncbi:MAG TPA: glycerol-3-phosphate acyltransferase [Firmicutes bacterium]|nr:glycerol-3-phosphate acyltransferase [Bacillota bacterium]
MKILYLFILAYLCGSISFAYLFTLFLTGKDIREIGTKNPGAANVARQVGKKWGVIVWMADTIKAILPMSIAHHLGITNLILLTLIGCCAVAGHCYPVFLKFRGGKGAASTGGILLYLAPKIFPLVIILWFFAQKTNPRSPKIILSSILIFFVFLILIYRNILTTIKFLQLFLSILILIILGAIINRKTLINEILKRSG